MAATFFLERGLIMPFEHGDFPSDMEDDQSHTDSTSASSPSSPRSGAFAGISDWMLPSLQPIPEPRRWPAHETTSAPMPSFPSPGLLDHAWDEYAQRIENPPRRKSSFGLSDAEAPSPSTDSDRPPLRFVPVTAQTILSGEIHKTQGEWKRGRPRLSKTAKSKTAGSNGKYNRRALKNAETSPGDAEGSRQHLPTTVCQDVVGSTINHLRITADERDFLTSLFGPMPF